MMDYRGPRRVYRRSLRNLYGIIWPLAIILFFITHSWIWFPLAVFAPMLIGGLIGAFDTSSQQQQQYTQPVYQPTDQPIYQQPYPQQPEQPVYQPYTQGYTPQPPVNSQPQIYQAHEQPYQEQQAQQQQYEDPLTMYPQG